MLNRTLLFVLLCLVLPGAGMAQTKAVVQGTVSAKRFAPVGRTQALSVEIRNFEDQTPELVGAFNRALRGRKFRVVENAPLILFIDTSTNIGGAARPTLGLRGRGGSSGSNTRIESQVSVPLDLSRRAPSGGLRYHLTATLSMRGRTPVWTASASATVPGGNRRAVFSALARGIVANLGRTVEAEPVAID